MRLAVVGHHALKHAHRVVQVARPHEKILRIVLLCGQPVADEVTAMEEFAAHDEVVLGILPTARRNVVDGLAFIGLSRHRLFAHQGEPRAAPTQIVQFGIALASEADRKIVLRERWLISIYDVKGMADVRRKIIGSMGRRALFNGFQVLGS